MKVRISNEIIVTEPTESLKKWCANNLVYKNPEYSNKIRMGLWLGNTPKKLQMYKTIAGDYILPFGTLRRIWHLIKASKYTVEFKAKKIYPKSQIELYDYQEQAVQAMMKAKNGVLVSKARKWKEPDDVRIDMQIRLQSIMDK